MAILEVLQLRIKPDLQPTDPSILKGLQSARQKLKDLVSDTQSRFYQSTDDPSIIHVLGTWPTLAAHHAFIESPTRLDVLRDQEGLLDFAWVLHVEIDSMSSLPLDAPVLAIERLHVKSGEHVIEYNLIMSGLVGRIQEATEHYRVVVGWRCDSEPGKQESLVFTGFETSSHASTVKARVGSAEWESLMDHLEDTEVAYGKDMEK